MNGHRSFLGPLSPAVRSAANRQVPAAISRQKGKRLAQGTALHDGAASDHGKHAGKNAAQADQDDQDLEQIAEATIPDESIHDPEKNRSDDDDDQNVDNQQNHGTLLQRACY
jgi:hypothetical protein